MLILGQKTSVICLSLTTTAMKPHVNIHLSGHLPVTVWISALCAVEQFLIILNVWGNLSNNSSDVVLSRLYLTVLFSFLALLPPLLPDDLWRVPFSLYETCQVQIFFRQLHRLSLQSRRHLPLWCRHEPVPDRHRQVFDRPAQATLPGCVQTWLDTYQLLIGGLYWGLHLHRRSNNGQWGQVGVAVAQSNGDLQGVLSRKRLFLPLLHLLVTQWQNEWLCWLWFLTFSAKKCHMILIRWKKNEMGGLISWKIFNHCLVALTNGWIWSWIAELSSRAKENDSVNLCQAESQTSAADDDRWW